MLWRELTTEQQKEIENCIDYILAVTKTQERLLDINILYGDGTKFKLTKEGFKLCYLSVKDALEKKNILEVKNVKELSKWETVSRIG